MNALDYKNIGMIRIVLVDDHYLVRNGIKMLLDVHPEIEVVAELDNGEEVLSFLSTNDSCDMVISDINMPEMDGLQLAEKIQRDFPQIKLIILSMLTERKYLLQAFNTGAKGYLVKNINYEELLFAVTHIHSGGKYLCDELSQQMIQYLNAQAQFSHKASSLFSNIEITEREMEVLYLIGDGFTNNEIAEKLFLSQRTVEGHRQNLIDKTGVKNSASLIKHAVLNGLIS